MIYILLQSLCCSARDKNEICYKIELLVKKCQPKRSSDMPQSLITGQLLLENKVMAYFLEHIFQKQFQE